MIPAWLRELPPGLLLLMCVALAAVIGCLVFGFVIGLLSLIEWTCHVADVLHRRWIDWHLRDEERALRFLREEARRRDHQLVPMNHTNELHFAQDGLNGQTTHR